MDKNSLFNTVVLPLVRHGLQAAAGYLIAQGQLDLANADTLSGAVIGLVTVAWWFFTRPKPVAQNSRSAG